MTHLNHVLAAEGEPAYLQIADAIRTAISEGRLAPGEKLPSCRRLANDYDVHRHTVMASMNELKAQGWIEALERRGYVVAGDLPDRYFTARRDSRTTEKRPIRLPINVKPDREPNAQDAGPFTFDLSTGRPDARLFPLAEFRSCLGDSLRGAEPALMGYGDPRGTPRLRNALADHLRKARAIVGRDIFVTNSSVEGIYLLAHLFLKPGDAAAIEAIGFRPAIDAIASTGASIIPVRVGTTGLDPDDLERQLAKTKIRLLYLTPLHQYPTTVTLSIENRQRIYALAQKHRFAIIEDDYDHEYHFASQPLAPLAANDPSDLVMYVSSFSKVMFPAIRVGFMALPDYVVAGLDQLRRMINRQSNTIMQEAVGRWMEQGGLERHLRKTRRVYAQRCDTLCSALDDLAEDGLNVEYTKPSGGMTVWFDTGLDSLKLGRAAAARKIRLTPDAANYGHRTTTQTRVRLGFATHDTVELAYGAELLRDLIATESEKRDREIKS